MLSPLLFNLFIEDIIRMIKRDNLGVSVGDILVFILLYADDIVLLAENEEDLQEMVQRLETFCVQSQMNVNIPKTKIMIFERKTSQQTSSISISFSGQHIDRVPSFKYLGIFFSSNLNFADHVNYMLIKAEKAAYLFWKYVDRFHSLGPSLLVNLFESLVTSIIFYVAEIWFPLIDK